MANPVGRPSDFDPAYCEQVIALGKQGKSYAQMASILNTSYTSMLRWRDEHEEFRCAMEDAQHFAQAWWEDQAQCYMVEEKESAKLNVGLWSRSMAARFPKTYRESTKQEITGADGAPLLTNLTVNFVKPDE